VQQQRVAEDRDCWLQSFPRNRHRSLLLDSVVRQESTVQGNLLAGRVRLGRAPSIANRTLKTDPSASEEVDGIVEELACCRTLARLGYIAVCTDPKLVVVRNLLAVRTVEMVVAVADHTFLDHTDGGVAPQKEFVAHMDWFVGVTERAHPCSDLRTVDSTWRTDLVVPLDYIRATAGRRRTDRVVVVASTAVVLVLRPVGVVVHPMGHHPGLKMVPESFQRCGPLQGAVGCASPAVVTLPFQAACTAFPLVAWVLVRIRIATDPSEGPGPQKDSPYRGLRHHQK
jgi:hypothetical protein